MSPYIIQYVLLIIVGLLSLEYIYLNKPLIKIQNSGNTNIDYITYFSILILSITTGLRDMIGGYDLYVYLKYFEDVPSVKEFIDGNYTSTIANYFEKGYFVYNILLKAILQDFNLYLIFTSFLCYLLIAKSIKIFNYKLLILLLFFCKFYIVGFVYVRQFIAFSIIWYAYTLLLNEKRRSFVFLVLIAFSFHLSAILALSCLFIRHNFFSKKVVYISLFISIIVGVFPIFGYLQSIIGLILGVSKLEGYSNSESVHPLYMLENIFLTASIVCFYQKIVKEKQCALYFNILVIYICINFMTLRSPGLIRYGWFFSIAYIAYFPFFLYLILKSKYLMYAVLTLYLSFLFYRNVFIRDSGNFIPYKVYFLDYPIRHDIYK